jgi:hypothetical protein
MYAARMHITFLLPFITFNFQYTNNDLFGRSLLKRTQQTHLAQPPPHHSPEQSRTLEQVEEAEEAVVNQHAH